MDLRNWQFNTRMNSWIMFFLSGLRTHKTMSMVATSPVWIVKEGFSIQINYLAARPRSVDVLYALQ